MKGKKLIIAEEIVLCFENQYSEKWKEYDKFFKSDLSSFKSKKSLKEGILTYNNIIEDLNNLISIIRGRIEKETKK